MTTSTIKFFRASPRGRVAGITPLCTMITYKIFIQIMKEKLKIIAKNKQKLSFFIFADLRRNFLYVLGEVIKKAYMCGEKIIKISLCYS